MHEGGPFAANEETLGTPEYAIRRLNDYNLSHLLLMGNTTDFTGTPLEHLTGDGMFRHFRPIYRGTLIVNVGMTRNGDSPDRRRSCRSDRFERPFIANPDLSRRFAKDVLPLAEIDWSTVYASGREGYADYPREWNNDEVIA